MATRRTTSEPKPPSRDGYHHGDLRAALIESAGSVLAERGLEGFSLREVARRSGVSPAAPAHHFGDASGLLSAVARLAFDGLTAALQAGNARGGSDPVARLREQGIGYVAFALNHPGRFGLMFRGGLQKDEAFRHSADAAFKTLEHGVRELLGVPPDPARLPPAASNALVAIWSVVHGYAHLAQSGQFDGVRPGEDCDTVLRGTLASTLELHLVALRDAVREPVLPARKRRLREARGARPR